MTDKKAKINKKARIKTSIFVLVLVAIFGVGPLCILVFLTSSLTQRYNRPEQYEQVEVVEKRIRVYHGSGKHSSYTSYTYIVAFKFPDRSVKELSVYEIVPKNSIDRTIFDKESYSSAYGSIQEGDTGILIYTEIKNIEKKYKNEDMRYDGRFFISFKKDPEYGGIKIETTQKPIGTIEIILFGILDIMGLVYAVYVVKFTKYALKYIHNLEV